VKVNPSIGFLPTKQEAVHVSHKSFTLDKNVDLFPTTTPWISMHVLDVLKYHTVAISHFFDLAKAAKHNKYSSVK